MIAAAVVLALLCAGCGDGQADGDASRTPRATPSSTPPAGGDTPVASPSGTPTAPTAGPRPTAPPGSRIVAAPIDDLELIVRESFPPQYAVRIVSGLPDGCHQFFESRLTARTADTFTVEVTNSVPDDPNIACTQVYGQHESVVELGSDLTPGVRYTVRVNDRSLEFTAE
jgi:hypothetical protein